MFTKQDRSVKRYSLSKQIADRLEGMIVNNEYAVGEKIESEPELMEIFQVSRNTLREAIQSLVSVGILEVKQGDGTYVKSNSRFQANMNLKYEQISIDDIKQARDCLEITIVCLAAKNRTQDDVGGILAALIAREELQETLKENTKADLAFHMTIANACHNQILIDLYKSILHYLENQISERQQKSNLECHEIDALHEKLYVAIRDGEVQEAANCARNIMKI